MYKETALEMIKKAPWEAIVNMMDDEIREQVHSELSPCTEVEFLARYLELAPEFAGTQF